MIYTVFLFLFRFDFLLWHKWQFWQNFCHFCHFCHIIFCSENFENFLTFPTFLMSFFYLALLTHLAHFLNCVNYANCVISFFIIHQLYIADFNSGCKPKLKAICRPKSEHIRVTLAKLCLSSCIEDSPREC